MRASMRCPTCNTVLRGGVPQCPQCAPTAAPPAATREVRRLPLLEEYVVRGYPADTYEEFLAEAKQVAELEGFVVDIRPPAGEELVEYERAVAAHQADEAARLKVIAEQQALVDAEKEAGAEAAEAARLKDIAEAARLRAIAETTTAEVPSPSPTAPTPPAAPSAPARQTTRNLHAVAKPQKK